MDPVVARDGVAIELLCRTRVDPPVVSDLLARVPRVLHEAALDAGVVAGETGGLSPAQRVGCVQGVRPRGHNPCRARDKNCGSQGSDNDGMGRAH